MVSPYSISDHKHRFSAWAASRAASVIGNRFPVEIGQSILARSSLRPLVDHPDKLPPPEALDAVHRSWRYEILDLSSSYRLGLTHGVAAKLINVYCKAAFVCGGYAEHPHVRALHPPIDSVLLKALAMNDIGGRSARWRFYGKIRWSLFDSTTYESAIKDMREAQPEGTPFWGIEEHWQGFH